MRQAENDLAAGEMLQGTGFHAQACFMAQQAAEKALKALSYRRGSEATWGHQVSGTSGLLQMVMTYYPSLGRYEEDAAILDQYYIATRYPDALPDGAPYEVYSRTQAEEAIGRAGRIVREARRIIKTN